ncbi:MAG TPA: sigma-70 family RNA polymerase sigma factor [Bacillaceae bacterium]
MEELNPQMRDHDERIESIMNDYGEEIKRLVYTYVKSHSAAEDITQEVFLTVYLKLDTFTGKSSLKTWVYSIAINKSKDYLRSWHVKKVTYKESILELLKSSKQGPDHETMAKMSREEIAHKVLELPIKYREVILLFYYKSLSIQEVSAVLGISENTVKIRLHRGREKLRKPLQFLERGEFNG